MQSTLGCTIAFRVMEEPAFVSHDLRSLIADAAVSLVMQCTQPSYLQQSEGAMKAEYTTPGQNPQPMFNVVDFAITEENGRFVPKLVELQGFPSLFGYQTLLADTYWQLYSFGQQYTSTFSGMERDDYLHLLHTAIVGGHHPDNVALLEYDPYHQKTLPDFLATQRYTGVAPTDIRSVRKIDNVLFHERGGAWQPIKRIYNRTIADELEDHKVELPFRWTDELEVEWAGHPNWYYRISKYSLPYLQHSSVPHTRFVSELREIPQDLENYVLKPLYAFAGKGVNVNPTAADIEAIPDEQRSGWVLMEKIRYAECLYTPLGMNKIEIRCMLIWLPEMEKPIPTVSLVRSGRGAMMGARFNSVEWTGATLCFFGEE